MIRLMGQDCGVEAIKIYLGETAMLVDIEIREQLSYFCMVTKQTQEKAANQALREMLQRAETDPVMGERMNRAKMLKTEMENLLTPVSKSATATS
jgi:hypothetical protein